ncbi:auxin-induced in root cultures protein 12-like [Lolium rigidum]|uniref:auxin-induced in root cultures protein 12-like n=1 Tax=Lolium rigidum TaxID=89674 RepID=UPI001F5DC113|nr:auxin-induced in root cultures protein 12-like [Lolium rigidum]
MASLTAPRHIALLVLVLAAASARLASAAGACAAEKFPAGKTYATCTDLPQLGAALHWTYDEAKSSLSVAFVAAPAGPNGWVAWALNPTGEGMAGAQALVALKGSSSAPAVKTYNITGYVPLGGASTPIAFPATELAADAGSGGKIRLYGKLQLKKGMTAVNQVWQVGTSVTGGAPDKHAFAAGNLAAKAKLVLSGKATAPAPAPAVMAGGPAGSAGSVGGAGAATTPAAGKPASAAATVGVSSVAGVALALMGLLAVV